MNAAVTIMCINASKAHQLSTGNENYSFNWYTILWSNNPMDQETDTNNIRVIIHELTTED